MKEVIVHPFTSLWTDLRDVPIPTPAPDQVIIKVAVAGSNVKDWSHITARGLSINSGDDIAGTIHALGSAVQASAEFHIGDRVAAFHPMLEPGGAYAEYAVAPQHTVFKLPETTGFEEAATIPLVIMTAGLSLYRWLGFPAPWSPLPKSTGPRPFIIYGASSALGAFAIKLAKASNIHPIIAICGGSRDYVKTLLDPALGDAIVDYRQGVESMKSDVKQALGGLAARHALDAISANKTWVPLSQMLEPMSKLVVVSGANKYDEVDIPSHVSILYNYVGVVHTGFYLPSMPKIPVEEEMMKTLPEFAFVFYRYLSRMLANGTMEGHPYEVIEGGLGGVGTGLQRLKNGEARGRKFVYRIEETQGR